MERKKICGPATQKNGGRFDQEWNDLASYVQYHPNELDEVARRIESFRAKLRE